MDKGFLMAAMAFILLLTMLICNHKERMLELSMQPYSKDVVYSEEIQDDEPWYKIF